MINWITGFWNASSETKWFVFNWVIYGLAIILTTLYCYARLDYVRSYKVESSSTSAHK